MATHEFVDMIESSLRAIEGELEKTGQKICSEPDGGEAWRAINLAVENVQEAIHKCYKMRPF